MPRRFPGPETQQINERILLWLFRLLVPLGGHREFVGSSSFRDDALAQLLGLGDHIDDRARDWDSGLVRKQLRELHAAAEHKLRSAHLPALLEANVHGLASLVGLSDVDCRVLEFSILIHNERLLDDVADWIGMLSTPKVCQVLAIVLGLPESEIRASLSPTGLLARSGLVTIDRSGCSTLRSKLDLLSATIADILLSAEADPATLLRGVVTPAPNALLGLDDYAHIAESLEILLPYLRHVLDSGQHGVNVFVYGAPGTGKTELTRVLGQHLDVEILEVATMDADGDALVGDRRLRALRAAQTFFAKRPALLVFDEAEDVFNDGDQLFGRRSTAQVRKAWTNRTLEENPVPTLWLSNSVHCLDAAFARRFDMVFELPSPPKRQRVQIVESACGGLVSPETIGQIAESQAVAPAVIARAARVLRTVRDDLPAARLPAALQRLVTGTLEAQGLPGLRAGGDPLPGFYDPRLINTSADLAAVAAGIARSRSARICLYGPPGTGKTAYGHWLADQLDVPLHVRRASDLLGMYVGETEKRIARCFHRAADEGALLLLDEADSFLRDRRLAQRSWEVSAVNEMLTRIEAFGGVLVASTNLMDDLDSAAMRRFDYKLELGYLRPDQAWQLLGEQCKTLGLAQPGDTLRNRLAAIGCLTPGDFATVARRHRFSAFPAPEALVAGLEGECAAKREVRPSRAIGFV